MRSERYLPAVITTRVSENRKARYNSVYILQKRWYLINQFFLKNKIERGFPRTQLYLAFPIYLVIYTSNYDSKYTFELARSSEDR